MFLLTVDYTSLCLSRLVRLTLPATGSRFRLVLDSGPFKGIIRVLENWIMGPLKGIIQFLGYPGIGSYITPSSGSDFSLF